MKRSQQILVTALWGTLVLAMVGVVVGQFFRHDHGAPLDHVLAVPNFQLTNQLNQPVSNTTLAGRPYIASFFFASCQNLCPMLNAHITKLQGQLPASVRIVSFSVDPDHDTPGVLEAYGKQFGADDSRWLFLTGPKQVIYDTEVGLKLATANSALSPLMHSDRLLLVDGAGEVRGIYSSGDPDDLKKIVTDATRLASDGGE